MIVLRLMVKESGWCQKTGPWLQQHGATIKIKPRLSKKTTGAVAESALGKA
jgi:hypothetical protein